MKLQIDFASQQGNATRNDCGAACVAMVASEPLSRVLASVRAPVNAPWHMNALFISLRSFGLPHEHIRPLHLPDARRWLANGNPVIALVNYGRLPAELKATDYEGNHYVVLTGYTASGDFLVHDPLWPDTRGAHRSWPAAALGEAWANPIEAMALQGIVIKRPFAIADPEMGELGLAVNAALSSSVAMSYLEQLYGALGVGPGPLAERQGHALAKIVTNNSP